MRLGYLLVAVFFCIALIPYFKTWQAIRRLVAEAKLLNTGARFNSFWWTPAWRVHRHAYPCSSVRRQIVVRFLLTFFFMLLAMFCLTYAQIHHGI